MGMFLSISRILRDDYVRFFGLLLLALLAYVWTTPCRDLLGMEARNALMSRGMLESGFSFLPYTLGNPYPDYLPLYFWLVALIAIPWGHITTISTVLPSALAATALIATTRILGHQINPRVGWLAAFVLATIPDFWLQASQGTIDMLLALNVTVAIACLYFRDLELNQRTRYTLGTTVFLVLAFLTKGVIGLVLPWVVWSVYLVSEGRGRDLVRFSFFMLFLAVACLGTQLLIVWNQGGMELVHTVIDAQVLSRVGRVPNQPFYYYGARLVALTTPWWLWAVPAFRGHVKQLFARNIITRPRDHTASQSLLKLALVWAVAVFIIFTLASTKKGRYLLPIYPAVAILLSCQIDRIVAMGGPSRRYLWNGLLVGVSALAVIAAWGAAVLWPDYRNASLAMLFAWSVAIVLMWLVCWKCFRNGVRTVAFTILLLVTVLSLANLLVDPIEAQARSGRAFVETAESQADKTIPLAVFRIHPDKAGVNVAFYSRRRPEALRFATTADQLITLPRPCLLFAYDRDFSIIRDAFMSPDELRVLAHGTIKAHPVSAYLVKPITY